MPLQSGVGITAPLDLTSPLRWIYNPAEIKSNQITYFRSAGLFIYQKITFAIRTSLRSNQKS
jgi:hypothetical protein